MDIIGLLIALLVTAVSLLILSQLRLGVEVDSFGKAIISAIVFGVLNALLHPVLNFFAFIPNFLTFGFFSIIVNAIIFGLAAFLVPGFRLRWGFWGALIGSFALAVINSLIYRLLPL